MRANGGRARPLRGFGDGGDDDAVEFGFNFGVGEAVSVDVARDIVLCISVDPFDAVMAGSVGGWGVIRDHRNDLEAGWANGGFGIGLCTWALFRE
jgi:hypothetical protein